MIKIDEIALAIDLAEEDALQKMNRLNVGKNLTIDDFIEIDEQTGEYKYEPIFQGTFNSSYDYFYEKIVQHKD